MSQASSKLRPLTVSPVMASVKLVPVSADRASSRSPVPSKPSLSNGTFQSSPMAPKQHVQMPSRAKIRMPNDRGAFTVQFAWDIINRLPSNSLNRSSHADKVATDHVSDKVWILNNVHCIV